VARTSHFRISHTRKIDSALRFVSEAAQANVILATAEGPNGRHVKLDGHDLKNFGSCSYMGLESLPELREAAHRAIDDYGTQFHFSRVYLQCELYQELEELLQRILGRPALVAASTSLAHLAALPGLINDGDHIIIDQFAHASLHMAVHLVPDIPLEILRHNRMDLLDARLKELRGKAKTVWYIADGLYSMLGDYAPFTELKRLLDEHDHLRIYFDDAHSTSWSGKHGRGAALDHFADDERVVVALSLNKAFSAAGGVLALPNEKMLARIRRCGGPMLFSGPIQPPMLGAAVGSARLHLSERFPALQAELHERLHLCVEASRGTGLGIETDTPSPIFQVACDSARVAYRVQELIRERGYYCCVCTFPAVPMNRPGLRFTISRHSELTDIAPFVATLGECRTQAMRELSRLSEAPTPDVKAHLESGFVAVSPEATRAAR
jgi:7-keto-8-aminopelargonate synthetase-like enzyme